MITQIISLLFSHILIPLFLIFLIWRSRPISVFDWLLLFLMASAYVFYIYLTGRWDGPGYYLRYILLILFLISVIWSLRNLRGLPFYATPVRGGRLWLIVQIFVFILFGLFTLMALRGISYDEPAVEMQFPLRNGIYYISQGGNSPVINYHNLGRSQKYAVDISKINSTGFRASSLFSTNPENYFIYRDSVFSPVSGRVIQVVDSVPDMSTVIDTANVGGIVLGIETGGVTVFLVHLEQGSITVSEGDSVIAGDFVAQAGNTGFTTEPVLHIHAEKGSGRFLEGAGVPILFDGQFLVRNDLVKF